MGTGGLPDLCLDPSLFCHLEVYQIFGQGSIPDGDATVCVDHRLPGSVSHARRGRQGSELLLPTQLGGAGQGKRK